jgi:hypothetical protein
MIANCSVAKFETSKWIHRRASDTWCGCRSTIGQKSVIMQGSAFGGNWRTGMIISWRFSVQRVNWALRCLEFDD